MEVLPSSNHILLPALGYKQANKLVNRVSVTSSPEIFGAVLVPCLKLV